MPGCKDSNNYKGRREDHHRCPRVRSPKWLRPSNYLNTNRYTEISCLPRILKQRLHNQDHLPNLILRTCLLRLRTTNLPNHCKCTHSCSRLRSELTCDQPPSPVSRTRSREVDLPTNLFHSRTQPSQVSAVPARMQQDQSGSDDPVRG